MGQMRLRRLQIPACGDVAQGNRRRRLGKFRARRSGASGRRPAALRVGVDWPRSCRNGTCRTCICQLVSGEVTYTVAWPGLSAEEKAEGLVLPCVAQPLSDVVLLHPAAKAG